MFCLHWSQRTPITASLPGIICQTEALILKMTPVKNKQTHSTGGKLWPTRLCPHWDSFTIKCVEMFLLYAQNKCTSKVTVGLLTCLHHLFCSHHWVSEWIRITLHWQVCARYLRLTYCHIPFFSITMSQCVISLNMTIEYRIACLWSKIYESKHASFI